MDESSEVRKVLGIDAQDGYSWRVRHGFMQNYNSADDVHCIAHLNGVTCGRTGSHPIHKIDKE